MGILEEIGIEFRDPESLALWRGAGADVEDQRVRIDRALLMELVAQAPETYIPSKAAYTLQSRNPARTVRVGGRDTVICPAYGSPSVLDLDDRRRDATIVDFHNFAKFAYMSPTMHLTGASCASRSTSRCPSATCT